MKAKRPQKNKQITPFQYAFLAPKYWGIWLGLGLLRLINFLPYKQKMALGKQIGKLLYRIAGKRRRLALANIRLALAELNDQQQLEILKKHFESIGIALIESGIALWGEHRKNHKTSFESSLIELVDGENLQEAKQAGKGVLIVSPHFTTVEMTGVLLSFLTPFRPVYRPHDNPLMDYLIAKGRSIEFDDGSKVQPISNANTREMLKALRNGECMVILPDQRYRTKGHVKVPFFNHIAPSNPATSKLSKLTGCKVVLAFTSRLDNGKYQIRFLPALKDFPSGDDYQDTLRLHHIYEDAIRSNPTQYLWVHNRWDLKDY
ncbi:MULTISPECIES: lipid A biosynthesis acyltransferase [Thiomicrorhabdus]|uniref:Lipid A biosynthesis acyltransferase n=1 Tax=Thiomicrorhabdus heinhorstiae TaxID=2748010 RepID=A0ABS0BXW7_9GAMM|nr:MULTISPECIES: lipid A biosynthesis acyltransferase [Thiomicrorhabdus]MBF6058642.1 lipid A biosynthesis acyltransferase [Thiomicrorhabdus heinhorstiae]